MEAEDFRIRLNRWIRHDPSCDLISGLDKTDCTCGLDKALTLLRSKPKATEFTKAVREGLNNPLEILLRPMKAYIAKLEEACALLDSKDSQLRIYRDGYQNEIDETEKVRAELKAKDEEIEKHKTLYETATAALNSQIEELEKHRWMPTDDPPDNIDWDKKVQVLECDSEIPIIMTMAEVFLNEGSDAEYWKPIILPKQDLGDNL